VSRLRVWTSDAYEVPLPPGHPFPMAKYRALRGHPPAEAPSAAGTVTHSEPGPVGGLLRANDAAFVERALAGTLGVDEVRRLGMPWSEALVTRARAAVFGTVQAAFAALADGVAGNLAGGTHHAFRDRGEGYCLFNDHAVAIAALRAAGRAARPFIVDLDVHQGNGTAAIFAADPTVFTLSLHGRTNYAPARILNKAPNTAFCNGRLEGRHRPGPNAGLPPYHHRGLMRWPRSGEKVQASSARWCCTLQRPSRGGEGGGQTPVGAICADPGRSSL